MLIVKKVLCAAAGRVSPPAATPQPRAALRRRILNARTAFLFAALTVGGWGIAHHPAYREWHLARQSIEALQAERGARLDDPVLLYYLGLRLNAAGRYREADPLLRHAVGLDPASARCRDAWAQALLGSGLTTAAFGELREFAGVYPASPEAHLLLGKFYVTQRSMTRASEELNRTVQLDPRSGEAWAYLSAAQSDLGNQEAAREAARRAVELRPRNAGDHMIYAALLAEANRGDAARHEYLTAIALAPNRAELHREFARWLVKHGTETPDARLAEQEARRAVALMPEDAGGQAALGEALLRSGRDAEAVAPLQHAASLAPDDPAAALALAEALRRLNRSAEAEIWQRAYLERQAFATEQHRLWEALRIDPHNAASHTSLARLLGLHGDVEGAVRHHAMALHCALDAPPALAAAANDLSDGGHAAAALPLAERAAGIAASSPAAHEALANALLGVGQTGRAVDEYNKAAAWLPDRLPVYRARLARVAAERAAYPSAADRLLQSAQRQAEAQIGPRTFTAGVEALARQATALAPNSPVYWRYLLKVQVGRKETADALKTAARLIEIAPDDGAAHALNGVLLLEQANGEAGLARAESELKLAERDGSAEATWRYGRGLLALRRARGAEAAAELTRARVLDPGADLIWYQLARAQALAGKPAEAEKTMAEYRKRQAQKRLEVDALGDIAQRPADEKRYRRAADIFERAGLKEQAKALLREGRRRAGRSARE